MRTGDAIIRSSTFKTLCECSSRLGLQRGAPCPPCPRCRRPVFWTFLRGERPVAAASARRRLSALPPVERERTRLVG